MIKDEIIIEDINPHEDKRGILWTLSQLEDYGDLKFNHDKVSVSTKNVLRGFHCDFKSWKLVTCLFGEIILAVVNVDQSSTNYLKSQKIPLSYMKPKKVLIPPSYANAHLCLSEECVFFYKWSYDGDYPDVNSQSSYKWDEPKFDIKWPIQNPILSDRDHNSKYL